MQKIVLIKAVSELSGASSTSAVVVSAKVCDSYFAFHFDKKLIHWPQGL